MKNKVLWMVFGVAFVLGTGSCKKGGDDPAGPDPLPSGEFVRVDNTTYGPGDFSEVSYQHDVANDHMAIIYLNAEKTRYLNVAFEELVDNHTYGVAIKQTGSTHARVVYGHDSNADFETYGAFNQQAGEVKLLLVNGEKIVEISGFKGDNSKGKTITLHARFNWPQ